MLLKLDLRDLALFHFDFQLLQRGLTLGFRLLTIGDLLIQLRNVVFKLDVELQVALAHLFQFIDQF